MIDVVGGYYRERCRWPQQDVAFGSGGRAAIALSFADIEVVWHYYCPAEGIQDAKQILSRPHLVHQPTAMTKGGKTVSFYYFHPLSPPVFWPAQQPLQPAMSVESNVILRFGLMEGDDAVVKGQRVVFDPQSPKKPVSFKANGSTANSLAIVLNAQEVRQLGRSDSESEAVSRIRSEEKADVIIVKAGPHGCRVYDVAGPPKQVPVYRTDRVYKVGSGDVFSAAFTYHWAQLERPPADAADIASKCVARYCSTQLPSVVDDPILSELKPVRIKNTNVKVYIAAPFFTMAELWLVEQACTALDALGVNFFSPLHMAGLLKDYSDGEAQQREIERVVGEDLKGLEECAAVLAILDGCDPGTVFEIGWAVRHGIPIVALSQNPKPADQTMIRGSKNCRITDDFATAIYLAAWAAWES